MPGGNADQLGNKVRVGDRMVACSATVLKAGKEGEYERRGYGGRPYDSFERIMFPTAGQVGRLDSRSADGCMLASRYSALLRLLFALRRLQ